MLPGYARIAGLRSHPRTAQALPGELDKRRERRLLDCTFESTLVGGASIECIHALNWRRLQARFTEDDRARNVTIRVVAKPIQAGYMYHRRATREHSQLRGRVAS